MACKPSRQRMPTANHRASGKTRAEPISGIIEDDLLRRSPARAGHGADRGYAHQCRTRQCFHLPQADTRRQAWRARARPCRFGQPVHVAIGRRPAAGGASRNPQTGEVERLDDAPSMFKAVTARRARGSPGACRLRTRAQGGQSSFRCGVPSSAARLQASRCGCSWSTPPAISSNAGRMHRSCRLASTKYGKPILDRAVAFDSDLYDGLKDRAESRWIQPMRSNLRRRFANLISPSSAGMLSNSNSCIASRRGRRISTICANAGRRRCALRIWQFRDPPYGQKPLTPVPFSVDQRCVCTRLQFLARQTGDHLHQPETLRRDIDHGEVGVDCASPPPAPSAGSRSGRTRRGRPVLGGVLHHHPDPFCPGGEIHGATNRRRHVAAHRWTSWRYLRSRPLREAPRTHRSRWPPRMMAKLSGLMHIGAALAQGHALLCPR